MELRKYHKKETETNNYNSTNIQVDEKKIKKLCLAKTLFQKFGKNIENLDLRTQIYKVYTIEQVQNITFQN